MYHRLENTREREREKNGFYAFVLVCEQLYTHARTPDGNRFVGRRRRV